MPYPQFRIRSLILGIVFIAMLCAIVGLTLENAAQRQRMQAEQAMLREARMRAEAMAAQAEASAAQAAARAALAIDSEQRAKTDNETVRRELEKTKAR